MTGPKMGGSPRLRVLVVGNDDVDQALIADDRLDLLVSAEHAGRFQVAAARVPMPRSDAALEALSDTGAAADGLAGALGQDWDVVVLSLQAEAEHEAWRDPATGLEAAPAGDVPPGAESHGLIDPAASRQAIGELIRELKTRTGAHVLLYNCSSVVPGDDVHCYTGVPPTLAERVSALNLEAIRISSEEGISIVDVDRIVAELGAGEHVLGPLQYSAAAAAAFAAETVRVITELGFFEDRPLVPQVGRGEG